MKADWFPGSRAVQLVMFTNVLAKIESYKSTLPITDPQVQKIQLICETFIAVYNFVAQARATMQNITEWQDAIFISKTVEAVPATPAFTGVTMPAGAMTAIFKEFRELVELIKSSPGYQVGIGEDLMIIGAEKDPLLEEDAAPALTATTSAGYKVTLKGSMQGFGALRVEYRKKGAIAWTPAAFFTKLPGDFIITPTVPDVPESGEIRARFIKNNQDFGDFSPYYPVTVS